MVEWHEGSTSTGLGGGSSLDVVWVLVGGDVRRRARSWGLVVLLVGVAGGITLASLAGWRRTSTAMERFVDHHRPMNAYAEGTLSRDDLLAIDGVDHVLGGDYFLMVPVDAAGEVHEEQLGKVNPFSHDDDGAFRRYSRPILVAGELADPEDPAEVMVDEEMARLHHLEPGSTLTMQGYAFDQMEQLFSQLGRLEPTGEVFDFTVTGIIRSPQDVVPHQSVPDVVYLGSAELHLGAAFDRAHREIDVPSLGAMFGDQRGPEAAGWELRVDFDRVSRDELTAQVEAIDRDAFVSYTGSDALRAREEANRSIRLQASALLAFGVLAALAGAVLVSQALRRQLDEDRAVRQSLRALGADRPVLRRVALVKGAGVGVLGAVVAVAVAVVLSPLTPVGHARRAEVDPGISVDVLVLALGALAIAALVLVRTVAPVWFDRSQSSAAALGRPGLVAQAARLGLPHSVVAGVRAAVVGRGAGTVSATVLVAVLGVVAGLGFAASEERLATQPEMWGWTFDAVVGDGNDPTVAERAEALGDNPLIGAYAHIHDFDDVVLTHDGAEERTEGTALEPIEGRIAPQMLSGRAPADGDVALGAVTARRLGVGVGDVIGVDLGDGEAAELAVSGLVVMPLGFDAERIGEGVIVSPAGAERMGAELQPSFVAVAYAPGVDPDVAYADLQEDWGSTVLRPIRSVDVEQLHAVRLLPAAFSGLLGGVALVTLTFVLVLTLRHRRRDLALLRTLGFDGRQLRATVAAQATTLVLPAAVVGTILGVAVARLAWRATAQGMGAPEVHVLPVGAAIGSLVAAVVLANLVATVPGHLATRARPADALRSE